MRTYPTCIGENCDRPGHLRRMCQYHYNLWIVARSVERPLAVLHERFWAKVDKSGECWIWTANCAPNGYGKFWTGNRIEVAHRWSYMEAHGPIPRDKQIDHLCRTRPCVRPSHMELVTAAVNVRRQPKRPRETYGRFERAKTGCPRGHLYDDRNTYRARDGSRHCRACVAMHARNRRARLAAVRLALAGEQHRGLEIVRP